MVRRLLLLFGSAAATAGLGGLLYWEWERNRSRKALAVDDLTVSQLEAVLPAEGKRLAPVFVRVAGEKGVSSLVLAALVARETDFGASKDCKPQGDGCTGDYAPRNWTKNSDGSPMPMPDDGLGWGRGLGQHDYYFDRDWLASNDWRDAYTNISRTADKLLARAQWFALRGIPSDKILGAALASYNSNESKVLGAIRAGADPDSVTTGKDYGAWILKHALAYATAAGVPAPTSLTTAVA